MSTALRLRPRSKPPVLQGRVRTVLLGLAAARALVGLLAIPLAPALYRDHFAVLVLLRPTKEVLLAAGFFVRRGDVAAPTIVVAAVPLAVFGVWLFYFLGRAFSKEIQAGKGLGRIGSRLLPAKRIRALADVLERKGPRVVFLGRLAAFPSSVLAAAAGSSGLATREFLRSDGAGAVASIAEVLIVGYVLGAAYKQAGIWLTLAGVVVLLVLLVAIGRWLRGAD